VLNIGARYDHIDFTIRTGNNFVDAYNARIVKKFGGSAPLQQTNVDKKDLAPRGGFVWTPTADRRTSIHGGFGLFLYAEPYKLTATSTRMKHCFAIQHVSFNYANPTLNPFWTASNPATGQAQLRAFLAQNYPKPPDLSQAPSLPEVDPGNRSQFFGILTRFRFPPDSARIQRRSSHRGELRPHAGTRHSRIMRTSTRAQTPAGQFYEKDARFSAISFSKTSAGSVQRPC